MMNRIRLPEKHTVLFLALILFLAACNLPGAANPTAEITEAVGAENSIAVDTSNESSNNPLGQPTSSDVSPAVRIQPEDLEYLGAFRLPEASGGSSWDYSGQALTFYPQGDPGSEGDGFPGSLFGVSHDQQMMVSEISIPQPIISSDVAQLDTAVTLQPFNDLTGGIFQDVEWGIPVMGLEYLPPQDGQDSAKLYFSWGEHIQNLTHSHGWSDLDLSHPDPAGPWIFGSISNYATSDILFEIPATWADTYTPGLYLASGRFREGEWGGRGPALFAFAPWTEGNPPAPDAVLHNIEPLLLYGVARPDGSEIDSDETTQMSSYKLADHWWGGAWLTAGEGSAVIFAGTKAIGNSWYGFANGLVWEYDCADQTPSTCPEVPAWPYDGRGFWAEDFQAQIIFFDTNELGAVAQGVIRPYEPQPYAVLDLTLYLFEPYTDLETYKRDILGAVAFDRENGYLYVVERLADEYKSIIHVFKVNEPTTSSSVPDRNSVPHLADAPAEAALAVDTSVLFCPPLAAPTGTIVNVSTEAQIRSQAYNAAAGTTIRIAAGTYNMQDYVHIIHNGISLRSATGNRDDVILDFGGMTGGHFGILVEADQVTVADLTIRDASDHGVAINGRDNIVLYNLHIYDINDQLVKVNPLGDGSDNGLLACSRLEYTTTAPDNYTNGISAHDAHGWVVRDNQWLRIRTPYNDPVPTILFWNGSSDTIVERNVLINCYQGIAFGNAAGSSGDHTGGIVRNNFIYANLPHDSVIEMVHSTGWLVAHNTALLLNPDGGLTWGMEARFSDTSGTFANNLTNMTIWLNRDGATATGMGNVTNALSSWFINPAGADLHLTSTATAAIDHASLLGRAPEDIDGQTRPMGVAVDVGADEYGSGIVSIGVYKAITGYFKLRDSNDAGPVEYSFRFGPIDGDWLPITGDWDGDGVDTIGVYNPTNGYFRLRNSNTPGVTDIAFNFGPTDGTWLPIAGDWNDDGIDTIGLYKPENGYFRLRNVNSSGPTQIAFRFGPAGGGLLPIAGDWNQDGRDTIGVYNPATSYFRLRNSNSVGPPDRSFQFGPTGGAWLPIAGDWNGNMQDTIGVYLPDTGYFRLRNANSAGTSSYSFRFGPTFGDWLPIAGDWDGS